MDVPPPGGQRSKSVKIPKGDDKREKDKKPAQGSWQSRSASSEDSVPKLEASASISPPLGSEPSKHRQRRMSTAGHATPSSQASSSGSFRQRTRTISGSDRASSLLGSMLILSIEELKSWRDNLGYNDQQLQRALEQANDDDEGIEDEGYEGPIESLAVPVDETVPQPSFQSLPLLVQHTNPLDKGSFLTKSLQQNHVGKLPDYEMDSLVQGACRLLSSHDPQELDESIVEALLLSLPLGHVSCLEQVLPKTARKLHSAGINRPITMERLSRRLLPDESKTGRKVLDLVAQSLEMIHRSPYQKLKGVEYEPLIQEVLSLINDLSQVLLTVDEQFPKTLLSDLKQDLQTVKQALDRHRHMLQVMSENDYRSVNNYSKSLDRQFAAALQLLDKEAPGNQQLQEKIAQLQMQCVAESGCHADMVARLDRVQKKIKSVFKEAGLQKKYQEYLVRVIQNAEGTKGIHKQLVMKYGGYYQDLDVNFTPAASLRVSPPEPEELADPMAEEIDADPFEHSYAGMFCPSMARGETRHAVNLMTVEAVIDDKPLYREVRVGIPYAFAADERVREEVTDLRWNEILTTALLQNFPDQLQAAMANLNHEPIDLPVFYECLLSPDRARARPGLAKLPLIDPELVWCRETRRKVTELNGEKTAGQTPTQKLETEPGNVKTLTIHDSGGIAYKIRVKPRVRMAISPCNNMAFNPLLARSGTWDYADETTLRVLADFMGSLNPGDAITGEAGKLLNSGKCSPLKHQKLRELVTQIRESYHDNRHHQLTLQPLHPGNLVNKLARELGYANVIGCKSAKDRTGNKSQSLMKLDMDCLMAERRWLAAGGKGQLIPLAATRLTQEDLLNCTQLVLNSGQTENQQKNTAIPGYKMQAYMLGPAKAIYPDVCR
ncbi:MAG: inositol phosphate phosphatase SopB [Endozoicomonas sp.]